MVNIQPENPPPNRPPGPPTVTRVSWPVVAICAWLVPGLGHALIGERRRAWTCGLTLLALFTAGLFIGGIDVVDRRENTLWFAGQALLGPVAFLTDAVHDHLDARRMQQIADFEREHELTAGEGLAGSLRAGVTLAYRSSIGRPHEIGALYCAVAGAMNLLVILDAVARATTKVQSPTFKAQS